MDHDCEEHYDHAEGSQAITNLRDSPVVEDGANQLDRSEEDLQISHRQGQLVGGSCRTEGQDQQEPEGRLLELLGDKHEERHREVVGILLFFNFNFLIGSLAW
eukprot:CAMPEP_0170540270 /NCGR_PEP_ID=MMETSP0211-20121228/295_1 /TAXON_ID=311385 /ORGANISM="Pseudokeronopsis sp., Strain OXSARD2" /LENGTH=102 /DNA_ID=CAMNT_0010842611 /DNA_START=80 /DNA_END=385 /DNA_ORIENTATION=-